MNNKPLLLKNDLVVYKDKSDDFMMRRFGIGVVLEDTLFKKTKILWIMCSVILEEKTSFIIDKWNIYRPNVGKVDF